MNLSHIAEHFYETYVGGKVKGNCVKAGKDNPAPVASLVKRDWDVRSFHVANVTAANLKPIIKENLHGWSNVVTDDAVVYPFVLGKRVASHEVVNHSAAEYSRSPWDDMLFAVHPSQRKAG